MAKIKCSSTFGNFKWNAEADVTDEQMQILASAGLLQVLQRSPASRAEKVLAGYEKRPDKFNRASIEFSDENAETLATELQRPVEIADEIEITANVTVSEHEIGATAAPKYADEKQVVARHVEKGTLVKLAEKVGFTGEGDLDADNIAFLQAIKQFKTNLLKSQLS